jgi:hypothetical protein
MAETTDEVAGFLATYPPGVRDVALQLRRTIVDTIPGIRETLDRSARMVGYGFGPGYADMICTIIPSKKGVKLGIARGTRLPDPRKLMEGAGKLHRYVALAKLSDVKRPGLKPLLKTAVAAWKNSKRAGS